MAITEKPEVLREEPGLQPIHGDASYKDLLSITQLSEDDIYDYVDEARAAEAALRSNSDGVNLLPRKVLKAVMRQPSTRTGGSMTTAMTKLGGYGELISGMNSSAEAKGESIEDSWLAFATQADILGIRTKEENGPSLAAEAIDLAVERGQLWRKVPVINLGDGRNEHPTQALGDIYTMFGEFDTLTGKTLAIVGDHLRYRAHHSLILGATMMGMNVIVVESSAAPAPDHIVNAGGLLVARTDNIDEAIREADALYMGRNPDEYDGNDEDERARAEQLAHDFETWILTQQRLNTMKPTGIVLHPRPRRTEIPVSVDGDPRMRDVGQMQKMIPMRMAIIARHMGYSIRSYLGERSQYKIDPYLDSAPATRS